jgi:phage terminase small subunit
MTKNKLTPKQERFVAEYLVDLNATQAAIRAGYSKKTAQQVGSENLSKPVIAEAIAAKTAKQLEQADFTAQDIKAAISRQVNRDVRRLFDKDGSQRSIHELSFDEAAMVAGYEVVKRNLVSGDGRVDTIIKVKLQPQERYVEMGAKHFALLTEQIVIHDSEKFQAKIDAARQRMAVKKTAAK